MARITGIVPAADDGDDDEKDPGEIVAEISDERGDTIRVSEFAGTYRIRLIDSGTWQYGEFHPIAMHTLALRILAHLNKNNQN